jgi:hypothetical protein
MSEFPGLEIRPVDRYSARTTRPVQLDDGIAHTFVSIAAMKSTYFWLVRKLD